VTVDAVLSGESLVLIAAPHRRLAMDRLDGLNDTPADNATLETIIGNINA
jgi:hypothetical protein